MQPAIRAMLVVSLLATGVSALGLTAGTAQRVTPVEKVIDLLTKLQAKVESEGKEEAAQYDKYSCFCKEQADNKLYAIEKSQKKIKELSAVITSLEGEIAELNGDIKSLAARISELEDEITKAVKQRDVEHEEYLKEAADMTGAIDAITGAIKALKDSKAQLTDAKVDLLQLRGLASRVLAMTSASKVVRLTEAQLHAMTVLAQVAEPGKPAAYEYQSNDIIATLQGLLVDFKQMKKELDESEFALKAAFDSKKLNLENEKKFASKEKAEKEAVVATKEEQLHAAQEDKAEETKMMNADQSFLDELTEACQTKASEFDQRSSTRANELTAFAEALEALKSGVAPNWGANKKLSGLALHAKVSKGHWEWVADTKPTTPVSFIQVAGKGSGVAVRAVDALDRAAHRLQSAALAGIAMKMRVAVSEDHFVKVRSIIKDLIAKLTADAEAEATQKDFCDTEMKAAITGRDEAQSEIESLTGQLSRKEAEKAETTFDISVLAQQISDLNKALLEATELRASERADNEKTIADAGAGKEAVEFALNVLRSFYEGAAGLVQVQYVPPNADREGKTVGDRAPEVFKGDYHGSQDASKGILGILEVILSDFERTEETVTQEEADAQAEFEEFEADTKADLKAKEDDKKAKEATLASIIDEITQLTDKLHDAEEKKAGALEELEKLKAMCVEGEETYAERVEKREQEIEALKEALAILEDWQK